MYSVNYERPSFTWCLPCCCWVFLFILIWLWIAQFTFQDKWPMADVTSQQEMLTPSRHLILWWSRFFNLSSYTMHQNMNLSIQVIVNWIFFFFSSLKLPKQIHNHFFLSRIITILFYYQKLIAGHTHIKIRDLKDDEAF